MLMFNCIKNVVLIISWKALLDSVHVTWTFTGAGFHWLDNLTAHFIHYSGLRSHGAAVRGWAKAVLESVCLDVGLKGEEGHEGF